MLNEVLQQELLAIIKDSHQGIIQGLEFAKTKAPELVEQILKFGIISNSIGAGLCLTINILLLILIIHESKDDTNKDPENCGVWVLFVLLFVLILIPLFLFTYQLLKVYCAPYLYLISFVTNI